MEEKLDIILGFLEEHKQYNEDLQIRFALNSIGTQENSFNKLIALLYDTLNTQSQPKINQTYSFFNKIYMNT